MGYEGRHRTKGICCEQERGIQSLVYYKRELFIYVLQRGLLKKMTKFNSWEGNKGYSKGVQVEEGET